MGEIVNLRQARRRAGKARREAEAAANRVRYGRTAAEKLSARSVPRMAPGWTLRRRSGEGPA